MSRYSVLYIDEEPKAAGEYVKLLSSHFDLTLITPEDQLSFVSGALAKYEPDLVLLDFDLHSLVGYNAPTIAGTIRGKRPDLPIVVFSGMLAAENPGSASWQEFLATEYLFDWLLDKREFSINGAADAVRVIEVLAAGYKQVRHGFARAKNNHNAVLRLLALSADHEGMSRDLEAMSRDASGKYLPYRLARNVIHGLLKHPGVLLDERSAAVHLGVEPGQPELEDLLRNAEYRGVFAGLTGERHYWRKQLDSVDSLPLDGLTRAHCAVCATQARVICDVCGDPFDVAHTIGVRRTDAPPGLESGRVCGICLRGDLPARLVIPEASVSLAEDIACDVERILSAQEPKS